MLCRKKVPCRRGLQTAKSDPFRSFMIAEPNACLGIPDRSFDSDHRQGVVSHKGKDRSVYGRQLGLRL